MNEAQMEMPKYSSHKEVWALKIAGIEPNVGSPDEETDGSAMLGFEEPGFAARRVDIDYMRTHDPRIGGYYVRYLGGYEDWWDSESFERGYTKVT